MEIVIVELAAISQLACIVTVITVDAEASGLLCTICFVIKSGTKDSNGAVPFWTPRMS